MRIDVSGMPLRGPASAAKGLPEGAHSVVVAACRHRRAARTGLRVVHVHPHAAATVDHLHTVDVAAIEGHALGAEDLAAGPALDAANGIGKWIPAFAALCGQWSARERQFGPRRLRAPLAGPPVVAIR